MAPHQTQWIGPVQARGVEEFTLAVLGSGSGNVVVPDDDSDAKVVLIERGSFGGTCINRGCIPTKMFSYTADLAVQIRRAPEFGLSATLDAVDWPTIRDRIVARVKQTSSSGHKNQGKSASVTLFDGRARFASPHELVIDGGTRIEAEQIVIATGGRPSIPPAVAHSEVEFCTSDTVMWLEALPASMVILGGGYVAVEFAHVFSSLGVKVHFVEMAATLLESLDAEISERNRSLPPLRRGPDPLRPKPQQPSTQDTRES